MTDKTKQILDYTKKHCIIRPCDVIKMHIHPEYLRRLEQKGQLIKINRGIYISANGEIFPDIGLVEIAKRMPKGVICLLSALQFHNIGTQSPFQIWVAIDRKTAISQTKYPPTKIVRLSDKSYCQGIEKHLIEGVEIKVYSKAKTIADCFKFRNKIGMDIALEALKDCRRNKLCSNDEIWHYAKICRVTNIIKPYLEAML